MTRKAYAPRTVIAAQRRVIDMAISYIETLPPRVNEAMVVDRATGLTTGVDVL